MLNRNSNIQIQGLFKTSSQTQRLLILYAPWESCATINNIMYPKGQKCNTYKNERHKQYFLYIPPHVH